MGLFEYVHRLPEQGGLVAYSAQYVLEYRQAAKMLKIRIEIMHRVSDFIDSQMLGFYQGAVIIQGRFFKKTMTAFSGLIEILITS